MAECRSFGEAAGQLQAGIAYCTDRDLDTGAFTCAPGSPVRWLSRATTPRHSSIRLTSRGTRTCRRSPRSRTVDANRAGLVRSAPKSE